MAHDREELKHLSEERVTPPPEFAISEHVQRAVGGVNLCTGVWLCCPLCRQGIVHSQWGGTPYPVEQEQRDAQVLAHMIQRHRWTRETVGEC